MKEATPVYVQLGYNESLESKKEILSSELALINLVKIMKRYKELRKEEFKIKTNINKSVKELKIKLKEMQTTFPFLKIPQKVKSINLEQRKEKKIRENTEEGLEKELMQIQARLKEISRT